MNWWEWALQPVVAFFALAGLIAINVLGWVFAGGRRAGKIDTRLKVVEDKVDNRQVLPACNEVFTDIKTWLSGVDGKVDTILTIMKTNQKTSERKRIKRKPKD